MTLEDELDETAARTVLLHTGADPERCPYCLATAGFTRLELRRIHSYAMTRTGGRGALTYQGAGVFRKEAQE